MSAVKNMETLEKVIFVVFVISSALYVFMGLHDGLPATYAPFMIVMNGLLGVKVFCGLAIMFLYFAGGESSGHGAGGESHGHSAGGESHGHSAGGESHGHSAGGESGVKVEHG
jgi:hypothetical protein